MLDAGVVHQDVHPPETIGRELHHVLDVRGLAHVGTVVVDLDPKRGNLRPGGIRITKPVEDDVGALTRQGFGNAQADATGGPGDEGGLVLEHR